MFGSKQIIVLIARNFVCSFCSIIFGKYFTAKRTYKISSNEYDYLLATEHINSIFNLISIIRYNFKNKIDESFLPFKIRLVDINLFYNVHITK